jgi:hypothetical protein
MLGHSLVTPLGDVVSGIQCPVSGVQFPVSGLRLPVSSILFPLLGILCPVYGSCCPISMYRPHSLDGGAVLCALSTSGLPWNRSRRWFYITLPPRDLVSSLFFTVTGIIPVPVLFVFVLFRVRCPVSCFRYPVPFCCMPFCYGVGRGSQGPGLLGHVLWTLHAAVSLLREHLPCPRVHRGSAGPMERYRGGSGGGEGGGFEKGESV